MNIFTLSNIIGNENIMQASNLICQSPRDKDNNADDFARPLNWPISCKNVIT